jgi:1-acyl-sn-glycerol-3-phosphate acyltransferase
VPSKLEVEAMRAVLRPWELITDPVFHGTDLLPDSGPAVFVGNHTIFGLLDLPLLIAHVHRERGLFLRGLGDHAHFKVPLWGSFLRRYGAVDGTRENARELLRQGEPVLVLPGGGREVAKRKGERYELIWKERMGFARLAIEAGCPVVPFGAVGAEETYDIVADADSALLAPVRAAVERLGGRTELLWPLARGFAGTPLPRPERFYFAFGEPIETTRYRGRHEDGRAVRGLRDRTERAVEGRVKFLLEQREQDPERNIALRTVKKMVRGLVP